MLPRSFRFMYGVRSLSCCLGQVRVPNSTRLWVGDRKLNVFPPKLPRGMGAASIPSSSIHVPDGPEHQHQTLSRKPPVVGVSRPIWMVFASLRWRHNGRDSVSNHQPHDCLLNRLFRRRSKKTSKLRVTGLCVGNSTGTGEFPAQMASNAENVSIWWRHHVFIIYE